MGRSKSPENSRIVQAPKDPNADRYPKPKDGLRRVLDQMDVPEHPIERLEVTFLASGEATYRVWAARAEEPDGGYLPPA